MFVDMEGKAHIETADHGLSADSPLESVSPIAPASEPIEESNSNWASDSGSPTADEVAQPLDHYTEDLIPHMDLSNREGSAAESHLSGEAEEIDLESASNFEAHVEPEFESVNDVLQNEMNQGDSGSFGNGPSFFADDPHGISNDGAPTFDNPEDPLGLNEYANSDLSMARDGLLIYKVSIRGIDSKEIRQSIREVIQDSRFGWNADQLMSQITRGELVIENLSAVKASVLVGRLKRLSLNIDWKQNAITQRDEK